MEKKNLPLQKQIWADKLSSFESRRFDRCIGNGKSELIENKNRHHIAIQGPLLTTIQGFRPQIHVFPVKAVSMSLLPGSAQPQNTQ